jgi:hypothetical protein
MIRMLTFESLGYKLQWVKKVTYCLDFMLW